MEKISKEELARRLDREIKASVGMTGLNTLLYGWKNFRHYGIKYRHALNARDYLFLMEVIDLSDYAGVDLTKKSPQ